MKVPARFLSLALGSLLALAVGCGPAVPTVDISVILPLTGPSGIYGTEIANGVRLRHELLLGGDEELGYNVTINVVDSEGDADQAAAQLETAFSTSLAAIGAGTSAEGLTMVPVADDEGRVLVSPSAAAAELSDTSEYFYRIFPGVETEASTMATFLRDRVNVTRLVLVVEDTPVAGSLADALEAVWGTELAGRVSLGESSDHNAMVQEALSLEPNGIYVAATGRALGEAIQALRLGGFSQRDHRLATSSWLNLDAVLEAAGPAANNVYFTSPVYDTGSPDEPMASFVAAYRERFSDPADLAVWQEAKATQESAQAIMEGMDLADAGLADARSAAEAAAEALAAAEDKLATPSYFAGLGRDSMDLMIAALSELETINIPSDLLKGMRAIRELPGVTGTIQFRETGDVQRFTRIYEIIDGEAVDFEEYWEAFRQERVRRMQELQRRIENMNRGQ